MDEQTKAVAKAKVEKINQYLDVFDNDDGKVVILDLMVKGHILKPTSGQTDRESILNEGKREMVLYILDMISYDVEDIIKIISQTDKKDTNQGTQYVQKEETFDFFKD